jgi:4-hydroxy-tetrahydrodipicolinate synthase
MKPQVWTALITPFKEDGSLDLHGLHNNIDYQKEAGIDGILVLGTTGETPTLSDKEKVAIIQAARKHAGPLMVGCGTNCTKSTIETIQKAQNLGADLALIVTPYYNKPTQEGIFRHFEAIAHQTSIPIVIYNIQGRCGVNIETNTLKKIHTLPKIVGVKEASGNLNQIWQVRSELPNTLLYSGDDALTLPSLSIGANGVISVASNVFPSVIKELVERQDVTLHQKLLPLFKALFSQTNPIPVKWAMQLMGLAAGPLRLPLVDLEEVYQHELKKELSLWLNETAALKR